jgi:hypothetical protein
MPEVVWSRSLEGERPNVLLGDDRIFLHYTAAGRKENATELICYDLAGGERWTRPGWSVLLSLTRNRFLVNTPEGRPLVVNGAGDILHRWTSEGVKRAGRHGGTLLLTDNEKVWAADLELRCLWGAPWPGSSGLSMDCFVGGAFYWVEGDALRRWRPGGQANLVGRLPSDLIAEAMDGWEQATGNPALGGWYIREGMSDFAPFRRGERPSWFNWQVAFDEDEGRFFLANLAAPHLILCLDRSGEPRWCKYVSCGCCGGVAAWRTPRRPARPHADTC